MRLSNFRNFELRVLDALVREGFISTYVIWKDDFVLIYLRAGPLNGVQIEFVNRATSLVLKDKDFKEFLKKSKGIVFFSTTRGIVTGRELLPQLGIPGGSGGKLLFEVMFVKKK